MKATLTLSCYMAFVLLCVVAVQNVASKPVASSVVLIRNKRAICPDPLVDYQAWVRAVAAGCVNPGANAAADTIVVVGDSNNLAKKR